MKRFFNEFKDFALRGNVMDLAIGVVIGGAFSLIITSLVNDILTPFISLVLGFGSLADAHTVLRAASGSQEAVILAWGNFVQTMINFVIIAFSIFVFVKILNSLSRKKKEADAPSPSEEVLLLQSILDEIKKNN